MKQALLLNATRLKQTALHRTLIERSCRGGKMSSSTLSAANIALPPVNREMKVLDRSFFKTVVPTSALTVFDSRDIQRVRAKLQASHDILSATTIKPIVEDTAPGTKCILLRPHVKASDSSTWNRHWTNFIEEGKARVRDYELTLTYDDWSMGDILDAILPELSKDEEQNPAGFAQVGRVAHLNLREQFLPYKHLVGQVLLDKNPQIKTVINKLHDVGTESEFRTFPYEVIAGPDDLDVTINHLGCEFKFNFGKVYWNTRNSTEHERLITTFKEGEALCDVMAGVGPFAIPAAKRKVWVRANDLNPACFEAMKSAIVANKVSDRVLASNMDGADFIRQATHALMTSPRSIEERPKVKLSRDATSQQKEEATAYIEANTKVTKEPTTFDHFVMNLPAIAIDFLWAFRGLYEGKEDLFSPTTSKKLPMIHVYTFQAKRETEDEEMSDLLERLSHRLVHAWRSTDEIHLHRSRLVAPNKLYYCASFRLPPDVAFASATSKPMEFS